MSTAVGGGSPVELWEERDFLLRSLEDLEREREAGDLDEADYLSLRESYTARAATVLRALENHGAPGSAGTPAEEADVHGAGAVSTPRRRWVRPALVTAGVGAVAVVAGVLMAGSAGERLPGDSSSGSLTATGPSTALQRARLLIGENKTLEAIKAYDEVLEEDPRQPEALAYRGWLLRLAGRSAGDRALMDSGLAFVDRAVAADPTYPDAHFFRGFILYQDRGDPAGAVAEFRAFLANDPPEAMVPVVQDVLRRALADVEAGAPSAPAAGAPSAPPG